MKPIDLLEPRRGLWTHDNWRPASVHLHCLDMVAEAFGLTRAQITSRDRAWRVARPRQVAMLVLKERFDLSSACIAFVVGVRDHSTVLHGIAATRERAARHPGLAQVIKRLVAGGLAAPHDAHVMAWQQHQFDQALARRRAAAIAAAHTFDVVPDRPRNDFFDPEDPLERARRVQAQAASRNLAQAIAQARGAA